MAKENTLQGPELKITLINKKYYVVVKERQAPEFLKEIKRFAKGLYEFNPDDQYGLEGFADIEFRGREQYEDDVRLLTPIDQIMLSVFFLEAFLIMQCALYHDTARAYIPESRRTFN